MLRLNSILDLINTGKIRWLDFFKLRWNFTIYCLLKKSKQLETHKKMLSLNFDFNLNMFLLVHNHIRIQSHANRTTPTFFVADDVILFIFQTFGMIWPWTTETFQRCVFFTATPTKFIMLHLQIDNWIWWIVSDVSKSEWKK